MTEYGTLILCDMDMHHPHSDWGAGHNLRCDKGGPWGGVGCSQDNQCSLWRTERDYWSNPRWDKAQKIRWDLALEMDHDMTPD